MEYTTTKTTVKRISRHCDKWDLSPHAYENPLRNAIIALRGGTALFSFLVEYTDQDGKFSNQVHTLLDTAIVYIGNLRTKEVVTRYPLDKQDNLAMYGLLNNKQIQHQININYGMYDKIAKLKQAIKEEEDNYEAK